MKPAYLAACALATFALSSQAFAQTQKAGLWEVTNKMQMDGERGQQMAQAQAQMAQSQAQMKEQMANLPPEQRKMVEEMMAKRGVGSAGPGGSSMRICLTKEQVERNEMPTQRGDCNMTKQSRSGNTMTMAFSCANPPSSGEGTYTFNSPESYSMKMLVNTAVEGKPTKMTMEGSGKWLGADCGSVKPFVMPKK